ncbi:MAG: replicative DNA helicase [Gaiellales bacterium]
MATNGAAVEVEAARVPPQDLDAEESVLGAMMLSPGAIAAVSEILSSDGREFYRESHAKIYRAALGLYVKGEPVDAITLVDELDERGELDSAGGKVRIHELAALVPASANAGHYAQIVREIAMLRGLIRAGGDIERLGWERSGPSTELLVKAQDIVFSLEDGKASGDLTLVKTALKEAFDRISHLYETGAEVIGLPTGFKELDRITAGLQPGNLIVLAARPGMGKSALGLAIAAHVSIGDNRPCAFFALEMSRQELVQRLMCSEAKVDLHHVRTGKLSGDEWPRLAKACARIEDAPLYLDDTPALNLLELRSRCQVLKRRQPDLGLIVVDYLQLMSSEDKAESRLQEVSLISRRLKSLARDLEVPVLALSQLSRAVEQRTDKRPMLSDLRESGTIEQDADLVMFLYRDEYYNSDSEAQGVAELKVAKHRNGPTDEMRLGFLKRYAKFSSLAA